MLAFRLALRLGGTVREVMSRMDAHEWVLWQAFDELSPLGDERGDMQAALVASMVANQWADKKDKRLTVPDLMPDFGGIRKEQKNREAAKLLKERWKRWGRLAIEAQAGKLPADFEVKALAGGLGHGCEPLKVATVALGEQRVGG